MPLQCSVFPDGQGTERTSCHRHGGLAGRLGCRDSELPLRHPSELHLVAGHEETRSVFPASQHTPRSVFFWVQVELKKSPLVSYQLHLLSANSSTRMGRKNKYLFYKRIYLIPSSKESCRINYHNFSILRWHRFKDVLSA